MKLEKHPQLNMNPTFTLFRPLVALFVFLLIQERDMTLI